MRVAGSSALLFIWTICAGLVAGACGDEADPTMSEPPAADGGIPPADADLAYPDAEVPAPPRDASVVTESDSAILACGDTPCATRCVESPLGAVCAADLPVLSVSGRIEFEGRRPNDQLTDWA